MKCLNELKRGYVNLKNNLLALFIILSYSSAYALPQDWPCGPFVLRATQVLDKNPYSLHNIYQSNENIYSIEVEAFWKYTSPAYNLDCGTSGCTGTITNLKSRKTENLHFYCETTEDGIPDKIKCYVNNQEEYLLNRSSDNEYRILLCSEYYKYVKINECQECFCMIHDSRDDKYVSKMGCNIESKDKLHCMNGNVYVESYRPQRDIIDYRKCADLNIN